MAQLLDQEALARFREKSMNPNHPDVSGTNQNPDIHFQQRETSNLHYEEIPDIVRSYMEKINQLRGTDYDLVNYYGAEDAEEIIVSIGSVAPTVKQAIDFLTEKDRKVGHLNIHLYRPFPTDNFLEKLPKTVKKIAVLDRTKEPGAGGEPLFLDVQGAIYQSDLHPIIIGGRYGLGSKDVTPAQILSVFDHLLLDKQELKSQFTIGITDDVSYLSLPVNENIDLTSKETYQAKFWGFGSDGTVSANKSAIKLIGKHTDQYVQGYFSYDSKKAGGLTVSHLRFGKEPIDSSYLIQEADFVACHTAAYLNQYDLLKGLKPGGTFLLNTIWSDDKLDLHLPKKMKKYIADHDIQFYTINAIQLSNKIGLGRRINMIMETAFFELANIMPIQQVIPLLKKEVMKNYARKSLEIVKMNESAIDQTIERLHKVEIPLSWKEEVSEEKQTTRKVPAYVRNILEPVNRQEGDLLTVGDLKANGMTDGRMPVGTAAFEKRGIALEIPEWNADRCTMCNECAFVCPHAAIRPFLADEEETEVSPEGFITREMRGADGLKYRIQVSLEDCTGCGLCVDVCPAKGKALEMKPYDEQKEQAVNWAFAMTLKAKKNPFKPDTVRGSQFEKPLLEFSGACSGCGETPYVKLLTQLFGDRLMIANATGCSSIWGGAAPSTPYTTNENGQGPAWSNSLFEDNAEFGYGMHLANQTRKNLLAAKMKQCIAKESISEELKDLMEDWIQHMNIGEGTQQRGNKLKAALLAEKTSVPILEEIYGDHDLFAKQSQWIIGGDGWAYDIGYGGIDHVLASGEDVNILVMDNEVYSNTGGQTSKATPASAIAKFSASGKYVSKKDLGMMAMTYGNVYVAQIASGANQMQTIKAFVEAEKFHGPSLIIAYTPCIAHGMKGGLGESLKEAKEAVESGYWSLYRYNPELLDKGKIPMSLDYKKPNFADMKTFMLKELRFSALQAAHKEMADQLFDKTVQDAKRRFYNYARIAGQEEKIRQKLEPKVE